MGEEREIYKRVIKYIIGVKLQPQREGLQVKSTAGVRKVDVTVWNMSRVGGDLFHIIKEGKREGFPLLPTTTTTCVPGFQPLPVVHVEVP